jgi:hypothetical protein
MQEDERDVVEVLKFDLIEETVGSWLCAIMRRLEKEQMTSRGLRGRNLRRLRAEGFLDVEGRKNRGKRPARTETRPGLCGIGPKRGNLRTSQWL